MSGTLSGKSLLETTQILADRDPDFARILDHYGPPPLWDRRPGFATLLRIILEQQVSLASAEAMYRRLEEQLRALTPPTVLAAGPAGLRALGVTRQKSAYFINIARAVENRELNLHELEQLDDGLVFAKLTSIKGIGPWTAGIYLLMALCRPDAWPSGDIALLTAYQNLKGLLYRPASVQLDQVAEAWRPHRATAARLLWHFYLGEKANRKSI